MVRRILFVGLVLVTALALRLVDVNPAVAQSRTIFAWEVDQSPGLDPSASPWDEISGVQVQLTAQGVTVPIGGGSVPFVSIRAVHFDGVLFVSVEWIDRTLNDFSSATESFTDSAAIQLPAEDGSSVPAICMGQADGAVNIWHWRADSQHGLDELGRGAEFVDLYPNTDDLFYPARSAGNLLALPNSEVVSNLVASGFGTLQPAESGTIVGQGTYADEQWNVVFARPFSASDDMQPTFGDGMEFDLAFAVWDGDQGDRDGQKSVSQFVRLKLTDQAPPPLTQLPTDGTPSTTIAWLTGLTVAFVVLAGLWLMVGWVVEQKPNEQ